MRYRDTAGSIRPVSIFSARLESTWIVEIRRLEKAHIETRRIELGDGPGISAIEAMSCGVGRCEGHCSVGYVNTISAVYIIGGIYFPQLSQLMDCYTHVRYHTCILGLASCAV